MTPRLVVARRFGCVAALLLMALDASIVLAQRATPSAGSPRPVAPVTVIGACPFECCHYGAWRLRTSAVVRTTHASAATPVATLAAGSAVTADRGLVVVTRLGVVVVHRPYRDPDMGSRYARGDSLLLLDYIGENFYNAWFRGRRRQVGDNWGRADTSAAQLVIEPQSTWWAHIHWRQGARTRDGWIDVDDVGVNGADSCG
jgi:hypothetical protein